MLSNLDLLATASNGVARLRELILSLAVQGKLVPQDPDDEPASALRERMRSERDRLIAAGTIKRDRPQPAISEAEKPFELPRGWEWMRLPDATYNHGQGTPAEQFTYIDVAAIDNALAIVADVQVLEASDAPSRARKKVAVGTVLYSTIRPYLKNIAVVQEDYVPRAIASTAFAVMHPHSGLLSEYLLHYLRSAVFTEFVSGKAVGVAYPAINEANFFQGIIAIPPSAEQSRIVTRVEELTRLCDALEANGRLEAAQHSQLVTTVFDTLFDSASPEALADRWQRIAKHFDILLDRPEAVDALEQTIFGLAMRGLLVAQDLADAPASEAIKRCTVRKNQFRARSVANELDPKNGVPFSLPSSWVWATVEQIATVCLGGTPARQESSYWNGAIPWVSSGEVANGLILDTKEKITSKGLASSNAKVYPKSTVLIAMIGQGKTRGQSALLAIEACTNQNVAGLILDQDVANPEYVFLWALHEYVRTRSGGRGGAQPALNGAIVRSLQVPLPPLAEQVRIVARVGELRRLCDDLRQRLIASQLTQAHLAEALVESAIG